MNQVTSINRTTDLWELVGLRIEGVREPLLGALRFRRQDGDTSARRSLASYLSSPPGETDLRSARLPTSLLPVAIKPDNASFRDFLAALNRGELGRQILVDNESVQLAFDFREENPSIERQRFRARSVDRMIVRTKAGHVVSTTLHTFAERLSKPDRFLGFSDVRQHTQTSDIVLPNLIVDREFISIAASAVSTGGEREAIFLPDADACAPLIGQVAWKFFANRALKARTVEDQPISSQVAVA